MDLHRDAKCGLIGHLNMSVLATVPNFNSFKTITFKGIDFPFAEW